MRSFLGSCNYWRKLIKGFATIAAPLTALVGKSNRRFPKSFTEEQSLAIQTLKERLITAPILAHPDFNAEFQVHADASGYGIGAVLVNIVDGREYAIQYISRTLSKTERNYSIHQKECLAVVWALEVFRVYLLGRSNIKVYSDCKALKWLLAKKEPSQLVKWIMRIQEFDVHIEHRKGYIAGTPMGRLDYPRKDTCTLGTQYQL